MAVSSLLICDSFTILTLVFFLKAFAVNLSASMGIASMRNVYVNWATLDHTVIKVSIV